MTLLDNSRSAATTSSDLTTTLFLRPLDSRGLFFGRPLSPFLFFSYPRPRPLSLTRATSGALWLVLMARLLNHLCRLEPAAYAALGRPVMLWLWWRWPASAPASGLRLFLQARGRLDVSTLYSVNEVGSIARVALWIVFNRPTLAVSRATRRQQQRLRACAIGFVLCLLGVVLLAFLL